LRHHQGARGVLRWSGERGEGRGVPVRLVVACVVLMIFFCVLAPPCPCTLCVRPSTVTFPPPLPCEPHKAVQIPPPSVLQYFLSFLSLRYHRPCLFASHLSLFFQATCFRDLLQVCIDQRVVNRGFAPIVFIRVAVSAFHTKLSVCLGRSDAVNLVRVQVEFASPSFHPPRPLLDTPCIPSVHHTTTLVSPYRRGQGGLRSR